MKKKTALYTLMHHFVGECFSSHFYRGYDPSEDAPDLPIQDAISTLHSYQHICEPEISWHCYHLASDLFDHIQENFIDFRDYEFEIYSKNMDVFPYVSYFLEEDTSEEPMFDIFFKSYTDWHLMDISEAFAVWGKHSSNSKKSFDPKEFEELEKNHPQWTKYENRTKEVLVPIMNQFEETLKASYPEKLFGVLGIQEIIDIVPRYDNDGDIRYLKCRVFNYGLFGDDDIAIPHQMRVVRRKENNIDLIFDNGFTITFTIRPQGTSKNKWYLKMYWKISAIPKNIPTFIIE